MRVSQIQQSLQRRLRRPGLVAGGFLLAAVVIILNWPPRWHGPFHGFSVLLIPVLQLLGYTLLCPIPWQWSSGSDHPSYLQGLLQSFFFIEIFTLLVIGLDGWLQTKAGFPFSWKSTLMVNLVIYAPVPMMIGNLMATRERTEEERTLARREAREAQTRLLQSQLHPHVLFNALNGLLELVHRDVGAAEKCIRAMSDLLRHLLQASGHNHFRLIEERRLVGHYLDLEQFRLGDRLVVEWEWDEQLDQHMVPPLLLQPLAENAIKHGIGPSLDGGILRVLLRREATHLTLGVWNTGLAPSDGDALFGLGLANLKSRLQLAYGMEAGFQLDRHEGWTRAMVTVPLAVKGMPS